MTTKQNFTLLGSIVFTLTLWLKLRQWAKRNGDQVTAARAEHWIADCRARGQRLNRLGGAL